MCVWPLLLGMVLDILNKNKGDILTRSFLRADAPCFPHFGKRSQQR